MTEPKEFFRRLPPAVAILSALLAGCRTAADLRPAPDAVRVSGLADAAMAVAAGVRMIAHADEWPDPRPIRGTVTPIRVVIENGSGVPLSIRHSQFALVGPTGTRFAALPLYRGWDGGYEPATPDTVAPNLGAPTTFGAYPAVKDTGFRFEEFDIAPYYSTLYRDVTPYAAPFAFDAYYYKTYAQYWRGTGLPTPDMLGRGIPEGVLRPGGRIEGWLYFEEVEDVNRVAFQAGLVDARTERAFGEIRVPFVVRYGNR